MGFQLSNTDKILSIVNSSIGIGSSTCAYIFQPKYFNFIVIVSITIMVITCIIILFRVYKQKVDIDTLKIKIKEQDEHIALLEKLMNVPFFKKWNLIYTFLWRSAKDRLKNNVILSEIYISRTLSGKGKIKDNNLIYRFTGELLDNTKLFRICIAGADNELTLDDINFRVRDIRRNELLSAQIEYSRRDNIVKDIVVFFKEEKKRGDFFELEFSWTWPRTAFLKSDYFSIPNIYSVDTKKIIMDFIPTDDMHLKKVEIWKFGLDDNEPEFISIVYPSDKGYHYVVDNPELSADYITYYE